MRKYGIIRPIRKTNPYKKMMKATKEHTVLPNLLNKKFNKTYLASIAHRYNLFVLRQGEKGIFVND